MVSASNPPSLNADGHHHYRPEARATRPLLAAIVVRRADGRGDDIFLKGPHPARRQPLRLQSQLCVRRRDGRVLDGVQRSPPTSVLDPAPVRVSEEHQDDRSVRDPHLADGRPADGELRLLVPDDNNLVRLEIACGRRAAGEQEGITEGLVRNGVVSEGSDRGSTVDHLREGRHWSVVVFMGMHPPPARGTAPSSCPGYFGTG
mmetsp:Transcript_32302/g.96880  ORF Transcript_32302/g.96880 Transcript_32302/m.96880 type:complete len:203 (+) Transcript_32302:161-769(+)